jgi:hypothetical protein
MNSNELPTFPVLKLVSAFRSVFRLPPFARTAKDERSAMLLLLR